MLIRKFQRIPRVYKRASVIAIDILLCLISVACAYWLRLAEWTVPTGNRWLPYMVAPMLAMVLYVSSGQYRVIFRYANWDSMASLIRATVLYGLIFAVIFTVVVVPGVPKSIGIIQPIVLLILISLSRFMARSVLDGESGYGKKIDIRRAIIFGAGSAGRQVDSALERIHEMKVVAFVDDDVSLHGGTVHGKRIYNSNDLPALIDRYEATDFLLAIPSASRKRRSAIINSLTGCAVKVRIVPGVIDIASGRVKINELREPEIGDLLGRIASNPDPDLMQQNIRDKTVFVSGAGGSIGKELCRQIVKQKPKRLILFDLSEFNLYAANQELTQLANGSLDLIPVLGSVMDEALIEQTIAAWKPDAIYHAAAYKHVPLVEQNVAAGLLNNSIGTLVLAQAAERHNVAHFVLISTDKAVRPTNVMGATKRLAELILQALAKKNSRTCFSMVRFGNVLDSSGSVVPLFRSQIRSGGPVTLTHAEITRYFMTIPEAAQLVIQAGAMAEGGEVFVLDMGQPVRIIDLCRRMIELSGLTELNDDNPDGDMEIKIVGLRPGEKLYEELLIGNDPKRTSHSQIMKAREGFIAWHDLEPQIEVLKAAAHCGDTDLVRKKLQKVVPEFSPCPGNIDRAAKPAPKSLHSGPAEALACNMAPGDPN